MRVRAHKPIMMALLAATIPYFALAGCVAAGPEDGEGIEESDVLAEGITGSYPVGTQLVASGNVNLRSGATTASSVLRVVPEGATVTLKASAPSGGFYKVEHDGTVGWSSGKYYTPAGGSDGALPVGTELTATGDVNLRSGPGPTFAILDVVPSGATVTLQSSAPQNGYYHVSYEGTVGWSSGKYYGQGSQGGGGNPTPSSCSGEGLASWSCPGSFGTKKMADCEYYATAFGCWKDANGVNHSDPGDNCIPACLAQAQQSICSGLSGPACERKVNWFAAGKSRWPCMQRLKVTNPSNGKSAVVVVLDAGPACWVEAKVSHAAVDLSYPAATHLFGGAVGILDKKEVIVEEVASTTPLGPQ